MELVLVINISKINRYDMNRSSKLKNVELNTKTVT